MADATELKNIVRLGTVMSVDKDKMTARVKFGDKGGIVSSPLHILKRKVYVTPTMEYENEGRTATENAHYHEAYITPWVPDVNDMVLCVMMADGDGDGFVIGEV